MRAQWVWIPGYGPIVAREYASAGATLLRRGRGRAPLRYTGRDASTVAAVRFRRLGPATPRAEGIRDGQCSARGPRQPDWPPDADGSDADRSAASGPLPRPRTHASRWQAPGRLRQKPGRAAKDGPARLANCYSIGEASL